MTKKNLVIDNFWTSNKSICGLRHFVLVNEIKENDQISFLLVSVIDVEINLKISYAELFNSGNWKEGWLDLPKNESITTDYLEYKIQNKRKKGINKIFFNNDSPFNIS